MEDYTVTQDVSSSFGLYTMDTALDAVSKVGNRADQSAVFALHMGNSHLKNPTHGKLTPYKHWAIVNIGGLL